MHSSYPKATSSPLILQDLGFSAAKALISPVPFTPIRTEFSSSSKANDSIAPPELSMFTSPIGANWTDFPGRVVTGETVISSKSNGSSEISMFWDGLERTSFLVRNMYMANSWTPSMEIGVLLFPFLHSMSLGLATEVTAWENWEAHLFLLASRHHPPPWQLNAPRTPVNCTKKLKSIKQKGKVQFCILNWI